MPALKDVNPTANSIADNFQLLGGINQIFRGQIQQMLRRQVPEADPGAPVGGGTLITIVLPDQAKVDPSGVVSLYVRTVSGGAVTGHYTPKSSTPFTTPTTGTFSSQPNGNIMLLAADLPTDVDVTYTPMRGRVVELDAQPVASNVFAIPAALTTATQPNTPAGSPAMPGGVIALLEAESLVGTLTGDLGILAPAAAAPATGFAKLDVAKGNVLFAVADAVTSCRVKLLVCPLVDLSTILEAQSSIM